MSKLAAIRRGRSLGAKISGEGVVPGEYFLVSTKLDTFCFLTVQNAPCYVPCRRFDTIPACDRQTDRQMDGQTDGIAVASTALAMRALRRAVKMIVDNKLDLFRKVYEQQQARHYENLPLFWSCSG